MNSRRLIDTSYYGYKTYTVISSPHTPFPQLWIGSTQLFRRWRRGRRFAGFAGTRSSLSGRGPDRSCPPSWFGSSTSSARHACSCSDLAVVRRVGRVGVSAVRAPPHPLLAAGTREPAAGGLAGAGGDGVVSPSKQLTEFVRGQTAVAGNPAHRESLD